MYRRLEENIGEDASGIEARVKVKGLPPRRARYAKEVWYTSDGHANVAGRERVRAWVAANRTALQEELRAFGTPGQTTRGALETDAAEWASRLNVREGANADRSHMNAWLAVKVPGDDRPLGQWQRTDITTKVIDQIIRQWQTAPSPTAIRKVRVQAYARPGSVKGAGAREHIRAAPASSGAVVATRTIRHRCRVFQDMWRTIEGSRKAPTPIDEAKVPKLTKSLPPRIPADVLRDVLVTLRAQHPRTFCQYAVFCTTLQRPAQIGRARPEDVDLDERLWIVRDCKGAPAHTINLGEDAVEAWRAFIAADAWGPVKTTEYGNRIHEAGLPPTMRPYHAKHTGAAAAIVAGVPWAKLQDQLGHTSVDTTKRSYTGFMVDAQREVASKIGHRFLDVFKPRLVKGGQ